MKIYPNKITCLFRHYLPPEELEKWLDLQPSILIRRTGHTNPVYEYLVYGHFVDLKSCKEYGDYLYDIDEQFKLEIVATIFVFFSIHKSSFATGVDDKIFYGRPCIKR